MCVRLQGLRCHALTPMTADYRFGRFVLRPAIRKLLVEGRPVALGSRAFDVLVALIERRERLVSKDELLDLGWPGLVVEENNLQVQISSLRKILGDGIIETVPGRGYRFAAELASSPQDPRGVDRDNLPHALTRFIGHEADLDEYERIVGANRLVTLTGAGGCGKTRIAVELASRFLPRFADGAWFVDLAPMADAERLPTTIARSLGLMEQRGQPIIEKLCEHVAEKQMLLVLDNCEHVVSACAAHVATLLRRANRLSILATSREPLGLPGEQMLRVCSLSCPPADQSDRFATFEAVQLFVDRARLVQPEFTLDMAAGPVIADICRRLDGIPLAIELAAARTKVCSVGELRKMLNDRLHLLVGGSTKVPPRQQTLLATIKWSFDLLTPEERELQQRLSVFSGGWTLESAVAVAGADTGQYELLEQLTHLVDKSLITTHRREPDATRYSMLETVRQYGLETIEAAGAETATAARHLEYFVVLAERLEPAFGRRGDREALEQLAPEIDNIVQALRGCERLPGGPDLGLRLVAALEKYWVSLGLLELGYRLTTEALARRSAALSSRARARALDVAARLAQMLARLDEGRDHANECLSLARALHDEHMEAGALKSLGAIAVDLGNTAQGIALCEQLLGLARRRADFERIADALSTLGVAHFFLGNFDEAAQIFEESLQIARDREDDHAVAVAACNVADAYIYRGKLAQASPLLLEAIDVSSRAGSKWTMFKVLDTTTGLAAAAQAGSPAARMLGAADAAGKLVAHKRHSAEAQYWKDIATSIKNSMGVAEFQVAYDDGHAMTVEQAIADVRVWLEKSAPAAKSDAR
jgi:predicted ATPase/DNA-binding winged helix-turn-helix (wHTH) protein